jgi:hypothetical protein
MKKMLKEGNQIHNYGTVINYGSGSDFLTSYGSTRKKVTIPYGSDSGSGSIKLILRIRIWILRIRILFLRILNTERKGCC